MSIEVRLRFLGWILLLAAIPLGCGDSAAPEGEALHERLAALQSEVLDRRDEGRRDEAVAALRRMAELAPDHPWPYELTVRIHSTPPRFEEAEELMRSLGSEGPGLAFGLAQIDLYRRKRERALETLPDVLEQYESSGDLAGQAFTHKAIGLCHLYGGDPDEAEPRLREALALFGQLGDEFSGAAVLGQLANLETRHKRYEKALSLQEEALAIQVRIGDRRGEARTWDGIGVTLRSTQDHEAAVDAFANAIALRREIGDTRGLYQSLNQLSWTHESVNRQDLAVAPIIESADLAGQFGHTERELKLRKKVASILSRLGRHREAIEQLELVRATALTSGEVKQLASAEERIGAALVRSGQYASAEERARTAVALASRNDLLEMEAKAQMTLANALLSTGQLTDALLAERRAYELRGELTYELDVLNLLNNLGAIYHRLGGRDSTRRYLEESLSFARDLVEKDDRRVNRIMLALALNGMGVVLVDEGRFEEAFAHHRESLELREALADTAGVAHTRMNLAELLWTTDRREEALELAGQAVAGFREIEDPRRISMALTLQADFVHQEGRHELALEWCEEALELARTHGFRTEARSVHALRAAVYEETGRPADALEELGLALELIDSQRAELASGEFKMRFLAPVAKVYERAVSLQARMELEEGGSAPRAFRLAERARARSLLDLLTESSAELRRLLPPNLKARELELVDEVSAAATRLTDLAGSDEADAAAAELATAEEELDRFKIELRKRAPEYSQLAYPDPVELGAVQQEVLRENETLLRYFFGAGRALLWVVDRRGAGFFDLGDPARIESLVAEFLARAGHPATGLAARPEGEELAGELARALLPAPLPAEGRLLVVPDGPLHRLPFEALRRDGRHLVEDHEIVVVPSATALSLLRESGRRHAPGGFLGLGDPLDPGGDQPYPSLPSSGRALTRIGDLFPPQGRVTLMGETCTKQAFRAQPLDEFRFLHFATHGWWDPDSPRRIGLRLSPDSAGGPAGFLYLDDVFPLELKAEMVVLAGCQTGLGELLPGEGLAGLTRAFLSAGARSVLVSLWNVSDRSTAEFMEAFYRELDGRTIPEALRRTRLSFIESDRPAQRQYYRWAPFVLVGDPGTAAIRLNREPSPPNP